MSPWSSSEWGEDRLGEDFLAWSYLEGAVSPSVSVLAELTGPGGASSGPRR